VARKLFDSHYPNFYVKKSDMKIEDLWGHIGYIAIVLGMIGLVRKKIWGWAARFIGEVIWLGIGISIGYTSIIFWGTLFLAIDGYGFYQWKKAAKNTTE
jgi:nicotinamide riboside transporter PnuC